MKKNVYKKITILVLMSFVVPRYVHAFPVTVVSAPIGDSQQILDTVKEYALDSLVPVLLGIMSEKISNKVFNKANGGATGDSAQPSYIENFGKYFSDLQMGQIDKFVTDLSISNNPFASDIAQSLIKNVQRGGDGLSGFNLDTVIGSNWKDFSTDASVGGWDGFLALSNPANTNIGSALLAKQDLANKIAAEIENEKIKLNSPGTRPQGECNLDFKQYKNDIKKIKDGRDLINNIENTTFDGISTDDNGNTIIVESGSNGFSNANSTSSDILSQSGGTAEGLENLYSTTQQNNQNTAIGLAEDYGVCLNELINNPVGLVTSGLDAAISAGQKKLSEGDEIGELIGGALLQITSTFIKGGLSSLQADFKSNKDKIGGPEQLITRNGQNIPWTQVPNTIVNLPEEFPSAIESTKSEVDAMINYIETLTFAGDNDRSFVTAVTKLDQCVPGPDYGFKKRFNAYVSKQTKKLDKRKNKGKSEKRTTKNIVYDNILESTDDAKLSMNLATIDTTSNIPGAGAMLTQVKSVDLLKQKYYSTKTDLTKKQLTLNSLYTIENTLRNNFQTVRPHLKTPIDQNIVIPFSNYSWQKLGTGTTLSTQQKTLVAWAKNTVIKIDKDSEGNNFTITGNDIPFSNGDWNSLSTAKKVEVLKWAKLIKKEKEPATLSDKDFVLGVVGLTLGINPTTNSADEIDEKRDFALKTIWQVWERPENYTNSSWDPESEEAIKYLSEKNKARQTYNNLQYDVSVPYTLEKARSDLNQIKEIVSKTNEFVDDCEKMRSIVKGVQYNGDTANIQYQQLLLTRLNEFKTDEVKTAIKNKENILSKTTLEYPSGVEIYNETVFSKIGITLDRFTGKPFKDLGLAYIVSGVKEDDYDPNDDFDRKATHSDGWYLYQVEPAQTLYELFQQEDTAFCTLNRFLSDVPQLALPNPILDGGRPILCSDGKWTTVDKKEFQAALFGTRDDESADATRWLGQAHTQASI
jgi:hypothetical protein